MVVTRSATAALCILALSQVAATSVLASPCSDAIDQYNAAFDEVAYRLKRYANCVSASRGHDDCYTEFRSLKRAHEDFEAAVNEYRNTCR